MLPAELQTYFESLLPRFIPKIQEEVKKEETHIIDHIKDKLFASRFGPEARRKQAEKIFFESNGYYKAAENGTRFAFEIEENLVQNRAILAAFEANVQRVEEYKLIDITTYKKNEEERNKFIGKFRQLVPMTGQIAQYLEYELRNASTIFLGGYTESSINSNQNAVYYAYSGAYQKTKAHWKEMVAKVQSEIEKLEKEEPKTRTVDLPASLSKLNYIMKRYLVTEAGVRGFFPMDIDYNFKTVTIKIPKSISVIDRVINNLFIDEIYKSKLIRISAKSVMQFIAQGDIRDGIHMVPFSWLPLALQNPKRPETPPLPPPLPSPPAYSKVLKKKIKKVDAREDELREAVDSGNYERVQELLVAGVKPNKQMLNFAEHPLVIDLLLKFGIDPNELSDYGYAPIHVAVENGEKKKLAIILQRGGDINLKNKDGLTPLHIAIRENQYHIFGFLLEKGADPYIANKNTGLDAIETIEQMLEDCMEEKWKKLLEQLERFEQYKNNVKYSKKLLLKYESKNKKGNNKSNNNNSSNPIPINQMLRKQATGETLATGDCLYSSIYRASLERKGVLERFKALGVNTESEEVFILSLRKVLADTIRKVGLEDIWKSLKETFDKEPKNYAQIITSYPGWFIKKFKAGVKDTYQEFTEEVAQGIETPENWAGEIEVRFLIPLLDQIQITLQMYNSDVERVYQLEDEKGNTLLHLLNKGEYHWVYYSLEGFELKGGKRKIKKTKRKSKSKSKFKSSLKKH